MPTESTITQVMASLINTTVAGVLIHCCERCGMPTDQSSLCPACGGYHRCLICGEWIPEALLACSECRRPTPAASFYPVAEPPDSLEEDSHPCEICGSYTTEQPLCHNCAGRFHLCHNCGDWISNSRSHCEACEEEDAPDNSNNSDDLLHFSDYKPSPVFLPQRTFGWLVGNPPNTLYMGVELEVDMFPSNNRGEAVHALDNLQDSRFYLKHDGSLDNGVEIVSHPATLDYHLTTFPWPKISESCLKYEGKSHDSQHAGLHVHINSDFFHKGATPELAYARAVLRLLYIFKKEWEWLAKFSRRNGNFSYCKPYKTQLHRVSGKAILRLKSNDRCDKYTCLNFSPEKTIEFRIFRGTLHLPTFFACLELVDFLARYVRKTPMKNLKLLPRGKLWQEIPSNYINLTNYIQNRFAVANDKGG